MQGELSKRSSHFDQLVSSADTLPDRQLLGAVLTLRAEAKKLTDATEKVWDFYFRVFTQRSSFLGPMLRATDRIALDCYQATYLGLGAARPIPSPAPFSYMHGEQGAATFRRGVSISLLGRRANPFPLIKLPYHRLMNAWTLGAVPHEVAHNLQADLGLWHVVPQRLRKRLDSVGVDSASTRTWSLWHKEVFADLVGVLLIGPAYASSLIEVVSRRRGRSDRWRVDAVHPTPLLRPLISFRLLARLGFARQADELKTVWSRLYPRPQGGSIPRAFLSTFTTARNTVVDEMCFTPYAQFGGKTLSEVIAFGVKEQAFTREAAARLAKGTDPGVVPERFLISAARIALDERLAAPRVINKHFYEALNGR